LASKIQSSFNARYKTTNFLFCNPHDFYLPTWKHLHRLVLLQI
jgi:hypothetical protein